MGEVWCPHNIRNLGSFDLVVPFQGQFMVQCDLGSSSHDSHVLARGKAERQSTVLSLYLRHSPEVVLPLVIPRSNGGYIVVAFLTIRKKGDTEIGGQLAVFTTCMTCA